MSLPTYPKYKASGDGWLGKVPAHWSITPVKEVASIINGYPFDSAQFGASVGHPLVRIRDIGKVETESRYAGEFVESAAITSDDVIVGMDGDFNVGRWRGVGRALLNQRLCCVRGISEDITRFLEYALPIPLKTINDLTYATTVKHLASSQVEKIRIGLPCENELRVLLSFLDRETGKIDAMIAEQQKLLILLAEKRQATILHAVTHGLSSDAPMKDSGVTWLGLVPAHWNVTPLAYRYDIQLGKMLDAAKVTGEHLRPYLRVFDVQWGQINTVELPVMDFDQNAREKFRLISGDILVNEGGSYPGRSAIWKGALDECYYQKALHRLRSKNRGTDKPEFFYYVMSWAANQGVFVAGGNETTIEHLPAEKLRRYRFAFPPLSEQLEIVAFLEAEIVKIDALTAEADRAVDLLKERRCALIMAAVTGKIDVREREAALEAAA